MWSVVFRDRFPCDSWPLDLLIWFGGEWNTPITKSQRWSAGIPSMRKPASREISSASVKLYEIDVCFLHIQLVGTNVWLPKMHKSPTDVDFWVFRVSCEIRVLKQSWSALLCCISHMCDECQRSKALNVYHKLYLVRFITARASFFTDHQISGLPIRAKYRHFRTTCEQNVDNSPTDPISSSLNWRSSKNGVATV